LFFSPKLLQIAGTGAGAEERSSEYPFLPLHWFCNSKCKKQLQAAYAEVRRSPHVINILGW
jgi:hypothetical protein